MVGVVLGFVWMRVERPSLPSPDGGSRVPTGRLPDRSPPSRSVAAAPERDGEGWEAFTGLGDAKKPRLAAGLCYNHPCEAASLRFANASSSLAASAFQQGVHSALA